jgi:uncharacterized membrane protein (DUF485 family)
MKDEDQVKEKNNEELEELKQRVAKLEAFETGRKQDAETRLRRRKRDALFLTAFPLILGLCLFALNPGYMGTMFLSCRSRGIPDAMCSQPYGWIMAGVFIFLCSASYFVTQRTSVLKKDTWWVNILLILLLLILPALLIVVLCPASIMVLESGLR